MNILIIQPSCPTYRVPFFSSLSLKVGKFTLLHFGENGIKQPELIHEIIGKKRTLYSFHFIYKLNELIKAHDIIICPSDLHWLNLFISPIIHRQKSFIFWGHGTSRSRLPNIIRSIQSPLVDSFVTYDDTGKNKLINIGVDPKKVFVANNTILVSNHCDTSHDKKDSFLYVGRLQRRKSLELFLLAFSKARIINDQCKIRIVGDGDNERKFLVEKAKEYCISNKVEFIDGTSNETKLKMYFSKAYAYVSPGPVGLGVLHSFAYGVPVLTMANEKHGPEFNNIINNVNSIVAEDEASLLSSIINIYEGQYFTLGHNAYHHYYRNRQIASMVDEFAAAIEYTKGVNK